MNEIKYKDINKIKELLKIVFNTNNYLAISPAGGVN